MNWKKPKYFHELYRAHCFVLFVDMDNNTAITYRSIDRVKRRKMKIFTRLKYPCSTLSQPLTAYSLRCCLTTWDARLDLTNWLRRLSTSPQRRSQRPFIRSWIGSLCECVCCFLYHFFLWLSGASLHCADLTHVDSRNGARCCEDRSASSDVVPGYEWNEHQEEGDSCRERIQDQTLFRIIAIVWVRVLSAETEIQKLLLNALRMF